MEKNQMNLYTESSLFDDLFPSASQPHLTAVVMTGAYELYGDPLPDIVKDWLIREIGAICKNSNQHRIHTANRIAQKMRAAGFSLRGWGTGDVSLAAFLCGISDINPLPPHYRCPHCRHSDFDVPRNVLSGYDLLPKTCPKCGDPMQSNGQNIPEELCFGVNGERVPHFAWACSEECIEWLQEEVGKLHMERPLFQKIDGCLISDLIEIIPDWHETLLQNLQKQTRNQYVSLDTVTREVLHSGKCTTDPMYAEYLYGKLPDETSTTTFGEIIWNNVVSHLLPEGQKALQILRQNGKESSELPFCRENMFLQLTGYGLDAADAERIIDLVRRRREKPIPLTEMELMQSAGVPEWYLNTLPFLQNLWRKAHCISLLQTVLKLYS